MPHFIEENLRLILFLAVGGIWLAQKVLEAKRKKENPAPDLPEPTVLPPRRRAPYVPPPIVRDAARVPANSYANVEAGLARQCEIEDRLQRVRETGKTPAAAAPPMPDGGLRLRSVQSAAAGGALRKCLRQPGELRRAVVLREILGPPLGLR